jgi:hypothetical protein
MIFMLDDDEMIVVDNWVDGNTQLPRDIDERW